ncbi:hypothetical protein D3C71_1486300 [compost metagenome]
MQAGELGGKDFDHLLHRPFGYGAGIDLGEEFTLEAGVVQQVRVKIENRCALFLRAGGKALAETAEFRPGFFQRLGQAFTFAGGIER